MLVSAQLSMSIDTGTLLIETATPKQLQFTLLIVADLVFLTCVDEGIEGDAHSLSTRTGCNERLSHSSSPIVDMYVALTLRNQ